MTYKPSTEKHKDSFKLPPFFEGAMFYNSSWNTYFQTKKKIKINMQRLFYAVCQIEKVQKSTTQYREF